MGPHQTQTGRRCAIAEAIHRLRRPLAELLAAGPGLYYLVTPELDRAAVAWLLPLIQGPGVQVRLLTNLEPVHLSRQATALEALGLLCGLPECEVRSRAGLGARVYAQAGGSALVTSAALTHDGLDANLEFGLRLSGAAAGKVWAEAERWWQEAEPVTAAGWDHLAAEATGRRDLHRLAGELSRLGVFIRVSVRGTRHTRRLDPVEFGLTTPAYRLGPVELSVWTAPEVGRAREELERELLQVGVDWNGNVLVPRAYAEQHWPRRFAARQRELEQWAASPAGATAIGDSIRRAREAAERWFSLLHEELAAAGQAPPVPAAEFAREQVERVLGEADAAAILEQVGLEYRAMQIVPEDPKSRAEVAALIQHPKFRTLQQRWPL